MSAYIILCKLKNLKSLNIFSKSLKKFPDELGNLTSLTHFDMRGTQVQQLPDSISNLSNLTSIELYANEALMALPESIGNLTNLEKLEIRGSDLKTLPSSIGNLNKLKTLGLYHNDLQSLSNSITNLKTLEDIDHILRSYIQGQLLISAILATIILIGYSIIGLQYALLLAILALFMNIIPFIGPWIAVAPALVIAYLQEPKLVIWVAVVTLVAQQIDSNLITPNVMGKSLDIHPLTIITVLLVAGSIAGFLGILVAVPAYAVGKVIVQNIYEMRKEISEAATKSI